MLKKSQRFSCLPIKSAIDRQTNVQTNIEDAGDIYRWTWSQLYADAMTLLDQYSPAIKGQNVSPPLNHHCSQTQQILTPMTAADMSRWPLFRPPLRGKSVQHPWNHLQCVPPKLIMFTGLPTGNDFNMMSNDHHANPFFKMFATVANKRHVIIISMVWWTSCRVCVKNR